MTDQPELSDDIKAALQEDGPPSDTTVMAWMVRANFLERQLAEAHASNEDQEITLDAVADLCGEALGTAQEYRSPIGCASALANYVEQLRKDNAAMREAGARYRKAIERVLDKVDMGKAFLDADTIAEWNDAALAIDAELRKAAGEKP